uniref:POT1PC domain-containing protein n=1 Tax=Rhabditophanes sp. KR3021 TaxID=114890 RepID=A0AC35TWC9_9BILA
MYITLMNGNYTIMKTKILEKWSRVGDGANPQHLTRMWRNLKGEKNVSPKEHVASQHMLLSYIANHAMINFYPISVKMSFIEEIDKYESSFSRTMLVQVIEVVETGGGLHYLRVWDGTLRDPNIKFVEPPPDWINDAKYFHVVDEDLKRETEKHSFFILCYKFREYFGQIRRSPGDFIVIKGLHFRKSNFYGIQQQEILVTESLFNDGKRAVVSNAGHSDIGLEIIKRHFNTIRAAINNKNNFFSYFEKSGNQYHLDQRVETQRRNQTQTESLHTLEEMGATTIISQSQRIQIMGRMYQATPQQLLTTMIEDPSDSEVTEVQPNSQSMAGQDTMILD